MSHPDGDQFKHFHPWACDVPESPRTVDFAPKNCRACLIAAVGAVVNDPNRTVRFTMDDGTVRDHTPIAVGTLARVRELLPEFDPLRVRAEQALLPLVASA